VTIAAVEGRKRAGAVGASGCSGRISHGTDEAGDRSGGNRSGDRSRCELWQRAGGCRLWAECTVPSGAHSPQSSLGSRHSAAPQGLPCRFADGLAGCQARPPRPIPDILSTPAEDMLANATWRTISWRTGTKGKLNAEGARRVSYRLLALFNLGRG
jgi:hypothetical protein